MAGSVLSRGMTSTAAPSWAPTKCTCETSSSSNATACAPAPPEATASSAVRKSSTCPATSSASSAQLATSSSFSSAAAPTTRSVARPLRVSDIDQPPSFERASEGHLVGILQISPDRQAAGQPGHAQAHRLDQPGQVRRRGLALEVRVGGQDELGHRAVRQPDHQLGHSQVIRPDPLDRANCPAEHVVATAELPRLLDRDNVLRPLNDTHDRQVPARVAADSTILGLGDVAAYSAEPYPLLDLGQRDHQTAYVGRVGRQQVERDPLRAFRPDARQPAELVDEVLDRAFVHGLLSRAPRQAEPTRLLSISYAVFCLKKTNNTHDNTRRSSPHT